MPQPRLYTGKDQMTRPNAMLAAERLERELHSMLDRCPRDGVEREHVRSEFMRTFRKMRALWGTQDNGGNQ